MDHDEVAGIYSVGILVLMLLEAIQEVTDIGIRLEGGDVFICYGLRGVVLVGILNYDLGGVDFGKGGLVFLVLSRMR